MKYRLFPGTSISASAKSASAPGPWPPAGGGRRPTPKRSRCCAARSTSTASPSSTRPTATATAAASGSSPRRFADGATKSSTPRRSATTSTTRPRAPARRGQSELPQRTRPGVHALRGRQVPRAARDRPHRRPPAPQRRRWSTCAIRELWETLRELKREGKIRAWGAAFGPAIGWLYEAVELCEREPDIDTIQMIWNVLEQHPGTAMIEAARRARAELLLQHPRDARIGDARGEVHRRHGVPGERPPPPPAALVAHQRRAEDPDARLPHRAT